MVIRSMVQSPLGLEAIAGSWLAEPVWRSVPKRERWWDFHGDRQQKWCADGTICRTGTEHCCDAR